MDAIVKLNQFNAIYQKHLDAVRAEFGRMTMAQALAAKQSIGAHSVQEAISEIARQRAIREA